MASTDPQDALRRRKMDKLSQKLLAAGFFSALGTIEREAFEGSIVEKREPSTWDSNNGTLVVYDEEGRPWIKRAHEVGYNYLHDLVDEYRVRRGAHVPHSNDGGHYMCNVLPGLMTPKS